MNWVEGRDVWWHELVARPEHRLPRRADGRRGPALHPLHQRLDRQAQGHPAHHRRLPARHVPHDASTSSICSDDDIYWCTADVGWITGHSYVVYGPLANGATTLMYEGAPNFPDFSPLLGDHRAAHASRVFYTAPTAIRAFMRAGRELADKHDLSSLRLLGTRRRADQSRGVDVVSRGRSATSAARSSTPGGRPKPARS